MDSDNGRAQAREHPARPGHGGTVEQAEALEFDKAVSTPQRQPAGERYELRDAMAEVTYRTESRAEILARAEQLGVTRFVAIDAEGRRTPIQKEGDSWQRQPTLAPQPPAPDPAVERESSAAAAPKVVPLGRANGAQAPVRESSAEPPSPKSDAEADRAALMARVEAALLERYVIKRAPVMVGDVSIGRTEYRYRGDTTRVAFTESSFRLATDTNSPSVARSMVDLAEARGWQALRVSGHEEFRRSVWFEASLRGVRTLGYEPLPSDTAWLRSEREARAVNRIEPARSEGTATSAAATEKSTDKASGRGGGGRKAVLAAIEAILVAKRVPQARRDAVMAAATEKLAERMSRGEQVKVKVYDKAAPSQRPTIVPPLEQQRSRERAAPAR